MKQKSEKTIIYRVNVRLESDRGFSYRISDPIEANETGKSLVFEGHRIAKEKLMNIDTSFRENYKFLVFYTYCREGDRQKALDMLKSHIINLVSKYKSEIDKLVEYCNEKIKQNESK